MTDKRWKNEVYDPFLDTWKIFKLIQNVYKHCADPTKDMENDKIWEMYTREAVRLSEKYPGNPFVEHLQDLLFNGGETIAKMNQEELVDD